LQHPNLDKLFKNDLKFFSTILRETEVASEEIQVIQVIRCTKTRKPKTVMLKFYPFIVAFRVKTTRPPKLSLFLKFKEDDRGGEVDIPKPIFRRLCQKAAAILFNQRA